ncbi:MAG: hypothetical protein KDD44_14560, partial [Bdellovibrionales bacterium]|nr:hypothetical protein [Bdellovibrionales bacterium]
GEDSTDLVGGRIETSLKLGDATVKVDLTADRFDGNNSTENPSNPEFDFRRWSGSLSIEIPAGKAGYIVGTSSGSGTAWIESDGTFRNDGKQPPTGATHDTREESQTVSSLLWTVGSDFTPVHQSADTPPNCDQGFGIAPAIGLTYTTHGWKIDPRTDDDGPFTGEATFYNGEVIVTLPGGLRAGFGVSQEVGGDGHATEAGGAIPIGPATIHGYWRETRDPSGIRYHEAKFPVSSEQWLATAQYSAPLGSSTHIELEIGIEERTDHARLPQGEYEIENPLSGTAKVALTFSLK